LAHAVGALAYVDAVHYGPHGLIDVAALDCDFLACSTYKFFGPHMGVLFGKREHLKRVRPYKVRPNTNAIPNCWEWGTLNHECIAGITACVEYLADVGRRSRPEVATRRAAIEAAYEVIHEHERCATLAVRVANQNSDQTPLALSTKLGDRGFFTWDGNYYALNLTEQLDVEKSGGFLRIGLVHYNTIEEVDRFLAALREVSRG